MEAVFLDATGRTKTQRPGCARMEAAKTACEGESAKEDLAACEEILSKKQLVADLGARDRSNRRRELSARSRKRRRPGSARDQGARTKNKRRPECARVEIKGDQSVREATSPRQQAGLSLSPKWKGNQAALVYSPATREYKYKDN